MAVDKAGNVASSARLADGHSRNFRVDWRRRVAPCLRGASRVADSGLLARVHMVSETVAGAIDPDSRSNSKSTPQ